MRIRLTAALVSLVYAVTFHGIAPTFTRSDCHPVTSGTDAQWAELFADGWHSTQADGMEAIYPPSCHLV